MTLTITPERTALLIMDYQHDILDSTPMAAERGIVGRARQTLAAARAAGLLVGYVVVRLRPGYPEVHERNKIFSAMRAAGRLQEGTPGAEIVPDVAPQPGEPVVVKRRVGAFFNTDLATVLGARGITTLALAGVSTSGVVLSTLRYAADADYEILVLEDLCADRSPEAHAALIEHIFPRQATVTTSAAFIAALKGGTA
jgi:nicotinamidase-related amidase